ncbi:DinB family protein [uncultured Dokdonia sp.]|uniref:DinB family protein n=1 Tax=uncultured Dokdonia sp. TaxID=575653 RepID=UPI00261763D1|nr:DinB family protein [uncultured Dokdonia sp.]
MTKTLFVLLSLVMTVMHGQQDNAKDAFLEKWNNSRDYLIAIAEAMPEDKYFYAPTEREMNFGAQLLHMRGNMLWLGNTYFSSKAFDRKSLSQNIPLGKQEIINALRKSFDEVYRLVDKTPLEELKTTVSFFAGPKSKLQILNLLQDHLTHHRGQVVVYLNLNNIVPPDYSGW